MNMIYAQVANYKHAMFGTNTNNFICADCRRCFARLALNLYSVGSAEWTSHIDRRPHNKNTRAHIFRFVAQRTPLTYL